MALPTAFDKYRPVFEADLKASIGDRDLFLYDMLRYHMGWVDERGRPTNGSWGKGLRPMMCLLACEAIGGDWRKALPAAVALELVHNFSLIHDDIQDGDKERRHRATVWYLWGRAQAINAGDSLKGLGTLTLLQRGVDNHPPEKLFAAVEALEKACLEMIEGQYLDISYEKRASTTIDEYLDMVSKKTGALMECSFYLGALLGSDVPETIERFQRCGRDLGLVFQIRDDILGVWGKEEATGKPIAADIKRKKKCLPVVYALQAAGGPDRKVLRRLYGKRTTSDGEVEEILDILARLDAGSYCQTMAQEYRDRALRELEGVELSPSMQSDLEQLADFLLEREH